MSGIALFIIRNYPTKNGAAIKDVIPERHRKQYDAVRSICFLAFLILFTYKYDKEVRGMLNRFGTDSQKSLNQELIPTQNSTMLAGDISVNVKYESEEARIAGQVIHKVLNSTSYSLEKN